MQMARIVLVGLMLVSISSCSVFERDADGTWVFDQGTVDGMRITPSPDEPITLEISSGAVTGHAGCNTYGIEADVYAGAVDLYPDRDITGAECSSSVMGAEQAYWDALQRVTIYRIGGDTLELEGEDTYLTFSRGG